MFYLFRLLIIMVFLFIAACVKHFEHSPGLVLPNHIEEYKQAKSAPKMTASKQFKYDDEYSIPDLEEGDSVHSDALIIPPGSRR